MPSTTDLLRRLRNFVKLEAQNQYDELKRQWDCPIGERVAKGWAIEGLRVVKTSNRILRFTCTTNNSRFREADLLVLHRENEYPQNENALHVELQFDGETELEFSLIRGNLAFLEAQLDGWVADQDLFDSSPFYLNALDVVADSMRGRSLILPLLNGSLQPKLDYSRYQRAYDSAISDGLDDSQAEAVAQSYATDILHLIQGPPGTGKTLVLAHLTRLLVNDGQRVLVTSLTHRAIHNALNKIGKLDPELPVCKIGQVQVTGDLKVQNFENFDKSGYSLLQSGYVIGATPFALQSNRLANVEFDVVIFDEASQVTLPLAIMGMLAGSKYIFIGDDKQLPPVTTLSHNSFSEDPAQVSIFGHLAGRGDETMLNITYRLNSNLSEWPSRNFYSSQLISSPDAANRCLKLTPVHTRWDFVLDPHYPAVFVDLCHKNSDVRSRLEAEIVLELIQALLEHNISPDEIGVVVPYRAQSRLIRSLLRRQNLPNELLNSLIVDTVERMQGQEKEAILVSFTTSKPSFALQMADFLFQPQRINVAVTRPRTKLILIGSRHMLDLVPYSGVFDDPAQKALFSLIIDLLQSCKTFVIPEGHLK